MAKRILVMAGEAIKNHLKGPVTVKHKKLIAEDKLEYPSDIRAIPTVEADKCILCGTCVKVCPTHCLDIEKENKDNGMIWILRPQCMMCGHCETFCPKDCIHVSGGNPRHFGLDVRTDYDIICQKGSFEGEKADTKLEELKAEGEKLKKTMRGYQ